HHSNSGLKGCAEGWYPFHRNKIIGKENYRVGDFKVSVGQSLTLCVTWCSRCNTMSTFVQQHYLSTWRWILAVIFLLPHLALVSQAGNSTKDQKNLFGLFGPKPTPTPQCTCRCGDPNDSSRIVGGKPTEMNEFPWMARLSYFNRFYCGGTLINDRYVLTAAHCVKGFMWFMIKVTFGEHDRCNKSAFPESRFVLRAVSGDFSYLNFDHDIALLRLNDKVPFTETIRPICLPVNSDELFENVKAIAAGWGTLKEDGKPSCILHQVEVPVMSNTDCTNNTKYNHSMISGNMICAGYPDGMKDSCQNGTRGRPKQRLRNDKKYELIGVVSWGNGCARPGYPGVLIECGRSNRFQLRFQGGQNTEPNEFPWLVAVIVNGSQVYNGALLNDRYVLTANSYLDR
ncbi:hypothetical protein L9F63_004367, partial [Diploptera punctata]